MFAIHSRASFEHVNLLIPGNVCVHRCKLYSAVYSTYVQIIPLYRYSVGKICVYSLTAAVGPITVSVLALKRDLDSLIPKLNIFSDKISTSVFL